MKVVFDLDLLEDDDDDDDVTERACTGTGMCVRVCVRPPYYTIITLLQNFNNSSATT